MAHILMTGFLAHAFLLLGGIGGRQWLSCLQLASKFSHILSRVLYVCLAGAFLHNRVTN
jgi:hypothetical protein